MRKEFTVKDKDGLHARPASIVVKAAANYPGEIDIVYKGKQLTLKSILSVMSLGIPYEETFEIIVSGEGEQEMLEIITSILCENGIV